MKRITNGIVLTLILLISMGFSGLLQAQQPSSPIWFMQEGGSYDSTTKEYTMIIQWKNGVVDQEHPRAEYYEVYRSMLGHWDDVEDFDLVGTIYDEESDDGFYLYHDKVEKLAGYEIYVVPYANGQKGERSPVIRAFAPGSYCVNMNGEIVDFTSFPETIAIPGESYVYEAYARHRSARVQGMVRYHLLEGPEGMTIDNKKGIMQWDVPTDASDQYYVKIKATSDEDDRAESIQEWYIRIANQDEINDLNSFVFDNYIDQSLIIYPNPAKDNIYLNYHAASNSLQVDFINMEGEIIKSEMMNVNPGNTMLDLQTSELMTGSYLLRIIEKDKISYGKIIIQ